MANVTIHTYYRQHDVYEVPREVWEKELREHGGDVDDAFQCLIVQGIMPEDGDTTEFYAEVENCE